MVEPVNRTTLIQKKTFALELLHEVVIALEEYNKLARSLGLVYQGNFELYKINEEYDAELERQGRVKGIYVPFKSKK